MKTDSARPRRVRTTFAAYWPSLAGYSRYFLENAPDAGFFGDGTPPFGRSSNGVAPSHDACSLSVSPAGDAGFAGFSVPPLSAGLAYTLERQGNPELFSTAGRRSSGEALSASGACAALRKIQDAGTSVRTGGGPLFGQAGCTNRGCTLACGPGSAE